MNKADIFHGIAQRNALRKAVQMPLLDVRKEFDRLVALQALEEYYALRDAQYHDDQKRILEVVEDEYRADYGWIARFTAWIGNIGTSVWSELGPQLVKNG